MEESKEESALKISVLDKRFDQDSMPQSASPLFGAFPADDSPLDGGTDTPILGDQIMTER